MLKQFLISSFDLSRFCNFCITGRGVDWAAQDVAQLRQWRQEGRKPREMRAMRSDWSLESIKTKLKHLRRGAPDESRPLKRRRDAAADSERAPSAKFAGHVALDVVVRPARRSPSAVIQARPCITLGKIELLP